MQEQFSKIKRHTHTQKKRYAARRKVTPVSMQTEMQVQAKSRFSKDRNAFARP